MPWHQIITASVALAGVLALIVLLSKLGRKLDIKRTPSGKSSAISVKDSRALDTKRRLHLVEVNGVEVLILTGGSTDMIVPLKVGAGAGT